MTARILEANQELRFRVSLARSSLLIDSALDKDTVSKLATHLLAEVEQVAYSERKAPKATQKQADSKIKMFAEGEKGDGKGKYEQPKIKDSKQEEASSSKDTRRPCKFYLTESGRKHGRNCKWGHVPDGTRRCYNCGGSSHISPNCPYKDGGPKVKATGLTGGDKSRTEAESASQGREEQSSEASEGDKMNQLLEEANDMLRSFHKKASVQAGPTLKKKKKKSVKTLRLTRLHAQDMDFWIQVRPILFVHCELMRILLSWNEFGWHWQTDRRRPCSSTSEE